MNAKKEFLEEIKGVKMEFTKVPEPKWTFKLGTEGQYIMFQSHDAPNWFFRWTQRIILGIYWEKNRGKNDR